MSDNLQDKTTEQLKATRKAIMIIAISITAVSMMVIAFSTYGMVMKDDTATHLPLLVVGLSCTGILPLQLSSMKKISDELKRREASNG